MYDNLNLNTWGKKIECYILVEIPILVNLQFSLSVYLYSIYTFVINCIFCPINIQKTHWNCRLDRVFITTYPCSLSTTPFCFSLLDSLLFFLLQGVNSMFQVFLTGNNSEYFTISPTAVQGRADIRMRVAMPLDFEHIRSYSFSVSFSYSLSYEFSYSVHLNINKIG